MSGLHKAGKKLLRAVANYDPSYYDMYADTNESLFAQLYLDRLVPAVEAAGIRPPATVLDAGCQAGRLAIPLARLGFRVTGLDTSGFALRRAQQHARQAGVDVTLWQGDLLQRLRAAPRPQFDIVVCAEVVYLAPAFQEMVSALADAVKPGGLLCVSHRPKMYYLLEAMRLYDISAAERVLRSGEGPVQGNRYSNWQTPDELRALYEGLGLRWLGAHPIDRIAWLSRMDLGKLSRTEQTEWLELERELPDQTGGCARYLLAIAMKPRNPTA